MASHHNLLAFDRREVLESKSENCPSQFRPPGAPHSDTDVRAKELVLERITSTVKMGSGTNSLLTPDPCLQSLPAAQLTHAKSRAQGFEPPMPPENEPDVIQDLLEELGLNKASDLQIGYCSSPSSRFGSDKFDAEFLEFDLSEFTVYLPPNNKHSWETRSLNYLATRISHASFLFDGILSIGERKHYVQRIPFGICSIGNYGKEHHHVGRETWIQSDLNIKSKIYYRLGSPSPEYARFHDGFAWLANLAKHFVDYCQESKDGVSVWDFKYRFSQWINEAHSQSIDFKIWYKAFTKDDFRVAIARNISFLYKEAIGVDAELSSLSIWRELLQLQAVPAQEVKEEMTVVTPYIYECFKETRFGHLLKVINLPDTSKARQQLQDRTNPLDFGNNPRFPSSSASLPMHISLGSNPSWKDAEVEAQNHFQNVERRKMITSIKCGDVLSVTKDGKGSVWKDEVSRWKASDECWYILVQQIHNSRKDGCSLDAIWLYKPSDTMCAKMKYPYANELFLSDNCTCFQVKVKEDEVLDIADIAWHASSSSQGFFVRQTYLENERFVTLKDEHKICEHLTSAIKAPDVYSRYPVGQTVLALPRHPTKNELEVYEIIEYVSSTPSNVTHFAIMRWLKRRVEIDNKGRPNELVYTTRLEKLDVNDIQGACLVRIYTESDVLNGLIPAPYCQDGTGNAFYITSRLVENAEGSSILEPIGGDLLLSFSQGFDPLVKPQRQKLRGLDLYCGGGNFGRGLEEGGAIHNEWAIDIDKYAIHTYYTNMKTPRDTKLYFGSVNDMLTEALQGNPKCSELIPLPSEVEFISAGSPCQGFSLINPTKQNLKGLRDQSLVASVAAYIDFYRPKYGLLENVMGMAQKGKGRDEDVFSQLICAVVGMGYQLRVFLLDAWSFGSPQSRSRLFVSFAAPGIEPLPHPALSHGHPPNIKSRGLGKLANGKSFGHRIHCPTPFPFPSAGEKTADLPVLGDGATQHCTSHPDHIVAGGQSQELWDQIRHIPKHPRGLTLSKAWDGGSGILSTAVRNKYWGHLLYKSNGELRESYKPRSSAFGRVDPDRFFATVLGFPTTRDGRQGYGIHWDEDRVLTVMEARRAQGLPDDEILVGLKKDCWKIIGNSVARTVSLALGLSLREAWLKNAAKAVALPQAATMDTTRNQLPLERLRIAEEVATIICSEAQPTQSTFESVRRISSMDGANKQRHFSIPARAPSLDPRSNGSRQKPIGLFKARRRKPPPRLHKRRKESIPRSSISGSTKDETATAYRKGVMKSHYTERYPGGLLERPEQLLTRSTYTNVAMPMVSEKPKLSRSSRTTNNIHNICQRTTQKSNQIPSMELDSHDSSDEEEEMREIAFRQLMDSCVPSSSTSSSASKIAHIEAVTASPHGCQSLKRPVSTIRGSRTRLPDKRRRMTTQNVSPSGDFSDMPAPSSTLTTEHSARRTKPLAISELNGTYQSNRELQIHSVHDRTALCQSCCSCNHSTDTPPPPTTSQQRARIQARMIHTSREGVQKSPSKSMAKPPPIVIDLISEDEKLSPPSSRHPPATSKLNLMKEDRTRGERSRHGHKGRVGNRARAQHVSYLQQRFEGTERSLDRIAHQQFGDRHGVLQPQSYARSMDQNPDYRLPMNHGLTFQEPQHPVSKYVPVDNSQFAAYAQTYHSTGLSRRR